MTLSPELSRLPRITASFYRAGLVEELIWGMLRGESNRNLVDDARVLLNELEKSTVINLIGTENIPRENGAVVVFNHPNMEVLLPAMLKLFVEIYDNTGKQIRLAMGSEIPLTTKNFNEKTAMPGSVALIGRFHNLYSRNIISVPTAENRNDFYTGRVTALRRILRAINQGDIIFISPEGHVEVDNIISPENSYHEGVGKLEIMATRLKKPSLPVAVWGDEKEVNVIVGEPFFTESTEADIAAIEAMYKISEIMPNELRGPWKY